MSSVLLQGWPGRSPEKRRADGEREMMSFGAAGGPRRDDRRKASGPERQTERVAVQQVVEIQPVLLARDLALIGGEPDAHRRLEDRVLEALLDDDQVRTAEAIVVVAWQNAAAVDIRSADRLLQVERHDVSARDAGLRRQKAHADA